MARKPRVQIPGAFYHVILRGNGGQNIFFDNNDHYHFYSLVQEGIERFGHRIHAFCLMNNHVHLAIQMAEVSLSRIIQNLSFRYTRWVNWRLTRSGHLFQGRYKAILVDEDVYLKELTRYIHLNPVRVGIVKNPKDYPWSGHRAYLGLESIPWLTTEWVLSQFSKQLSTARRAYERFVLEGKGIGHQDYYSGGGETDSRILGDDNFISRVLKQTEMLPKAKKSLDGILREICRYYGISKEELVSSGKDRWISEARAMASWLVLELGICSLGELGKTTGRDITTLCSARKRLSMKSKNDQKLLRRMRSLLQRVS